MSLLLRVRGFYLLNKQEKNYHKIAWIAEIAASQIVADRKGNAFIVEKIVKNCYAFHYYHCYLSIFGITLLLRFNFTPMGGGWGGVSKEICGTVRLPV